MASRMMTKCPPFIYRNWRLVIMAGAIAYVVLIGYLVPVLGVPLYIAILIGMIAAVSFTSLSRCDSPKRIFTTLLPSFVVIVLLLLYAIFTSGATLSLLGMDSGVADQASTDATNIIANVWLLSYQGVQTGMAATANWMAYGPACFGAGVFIMAWGDSRDDGVTKGFGTLLMFVPFVIDLTLNLSGEKAGLVTDLIPQLALLPQGGIMVLVTMLLNILPDVILVSLLIGVVERAVVEKFASPTGE